ncbi:MAG: ferrous iron transport protein B [Gammaproteobacteria bacterium]|nr:ferrous iron transport protein B [Gammaproteobacteria bacterium]
MTTIALVGNPNSGKSTLFNELTKSHQKIGNWPGVTVEKKSGWFSHESRRIEVIDLPGLYDINLTESSIGEDERLVRQFLTEHKADVYVNIVDGNSIQRGLFLTTQLLELGVPVVVVLTMMDVARRNKVQVDAGYLSNRLNCPVVEVAAKKRKGLDALRDAIDAATNSSFKGLESDDLRYEFVDEIAVEALNRPQNKANISSLLDKIVLNRIFAFPIFLVVMYLMFFFAINVGSVFIDFFDLVGGVLFVEGPNLLLSNINTPDWLRALICHGIGGGIQLVATFIPVIGTLFLAMTLLEDSGYMSRIAFILDKPMKRIGVPGEAFVPLIVGFGCNVPSVMGVRNLRSRPDRILATIMAPFMSCGARLTVYALFAVAFFPRNGQNIVFALYLLGIAVAIGSAWCVRKHLVHQSSQSFSHELPSYHLPTFRGMFIHTWHRLKGFVLRAGKAIVLVVVVLNMASTIGTDGSIGNDNKENSVLSSIGRFITPAFHPMGVDKENWPATVGIFTGMFAKEVVVGTLDTLYTPPTSSDDEFDLGGTLKDAFTSIPNNLSDLGGSISDPLGIAIEAEESLESAASSHQVEINTIEAMKSLFHGQLGAFSYLVFILLYMPCVATIGAIYKELGAFWAAFSTVWSVVIAYSAAVSCYQLGMLGTTPVQSLLTLGLTVLLACAAFGLLIFWGRKQAPAEDRMIPVAQIQ